MTAPQEPLVMTLGEALSALQKRGFRLVPPEEGTDSWGTARIANWDAPDHEFGTWQEAVSDALGVPVVARDPAAELRAAVKAWVEADAACNMDEKLAAHGIGHDSANLERLGRAAAKLRAALAATEGEA